MIKKHNGTIQSSYWQKSLKELLHNPGSVVGLILLSVITLLAICAPFVAQYHPDKIVVKDYLQAPSFTHWFGTDQFGRDVFARVIYGGRISLRIGIIAMIIALLIGVPMGLIAGYYGGLTDEVISRVVDLMLAFPGILLALIVIALLGANLTTTMLAVGISASPGFARLTRGSTMQEKEKQFVEAARQIGTGTLRIMFYHILPNVMGLIVVLATLSVANAIITGAALSFLGLGAQPPTPEWGLILSKGRDYIRYAWWITTFPGLAIMLSVLSINLIGDGLRDALDPRLTV